MLFFKSKPNVDDNKKAKVEFYFFQIAKALGWERCVSPIIPPAKLLGLAQQSDPVTALVSFVAEHLQHDVTDLDVRVTPRLLTTVGGGGG
ncbi:hypothetical protein N9Y42_04865 [Mariniblastus sp.]|nr:hypothetical protein [Mariniblastus sp.]